MNSQEYWAKREEENLKHYLKDEEAYAKEVQKIYTRTLANVQKEINAFYGNYARKENISLAEAKKRVSTLDIKAYEAKAEKYVKDRTFSKQANEEMRLYNATMRINRLEMLKANIGLELIAGHDDLEKFMEGILKGRTEEELKRQAGILGKTITNNAQMVHSIVNSSFHNAKFSDRIWMYQSLLRSDLEIQLSRGMIQGKNPRELARGIKERFDVRTSDAERLMRTELARVQTEAQKQSFIRNGFTQYMFIVNGGCCDICEEIKGKIYDVKDMQPGENAPPMHPHCRCSIAAYEDSKEYEAWLDFLDKGGTTATWQAMKNKAAVEQNNTKTKAIDEAKNIKELEEVMQEITGKKMSFSGVELELMKRNMKQLVSLADEYGVKFNEITTSAGRKYLGDVVRTGRYGDVITMLYPKKYYKNREALLQELKKASSSGSMPRIGGRNIDIYTTTHEFAHTLSEELTSRLYGIDSDFWDEIEDVYKDYKKNGQGVLGKYASTNQNEFMAEAFAEAKLGVNPSKHAVEVLAIVDKYFKKKK